MAVDLDYARSVLENRPTSTGSGSDILWAGPPKEGAQKVRILPPIGTMKLPAILVYTHWNIPNADKHICMKTFGKPCEMCNMLAGYANKLSTEDWDAQAKTYFNALLLDTPDTDPKVPHVYGMNGDFTYYWIIEQLLDSDIGDISDPKTGRGVKINRKKKGGAFDRILLNNNAIADTDDEIDLILSKRHNLDSIWKLPSEDEYKEFMVSVGLLDRMIKDKLLTLQSAAGSPSNKDPEEPWVAPKAAAAPAISVATTVQTPATAATAPTFQVPDEAALNVAPASAVSTNRPPNTPECYGAEWKDGEVKCMICPHELMCKTEVTKGT